MRRANVLDLVFDQIPASWQRLFGEGVMFLFIGTLILVFPQVLAAMVAAIFAVVGVFCISTAWRIKKAQNHFDYFSDKMFRVLL